MIGNEEIGGLTSDTVHERARPLVSLYLIRLALSFSQEIPFAGRYLSSLIYPLGAQRFPLEFLERWNVTARPMKNHSSLNRLAVTFLAIRRNYLFPYERRHLPWLGADGIKRRTAAPSLDTR